MNKQEQVTAFNEITAKCADIMLSKGDDYANTDRLSNFKMAGNICGLTPELNCLSLIATKVARLGVLLNITTGKAPNNESIEDSMDDLINYAILLKMIQIERENSKIKTGNTEIIGTLNEGVVTFTEENIDAITNKA